MRVLISAGEASGDHYGAELARALRRQVHDHQLEIFGLGGDEMRRAGCETVVDAHEIAVVGITEVISSLARIRRAFKHLLAETERRRPDVAVLIDFPDFNLRLAKQLYRRGIPVVYFVSPQVWAWRSGRVKQIRRYVRTMLVIFPFEVEWYRARGVEAEYVGYPLADEQPEIPSRDEFAAEYQLDSSRQWIALLPGSRQREVRLNLPVMVEAAGQLDQQFQFVIPVASTLDRGWLEALLRKSRRADHVEFTTTPDARATLALARAAVVASGTATVQAALAGTPFVMVYRVATSSYLLGRWMVRVPHFAMPNLIAGRRIIPELVQRDFTAANILRELRRIIPDGPERQQMRADLAEVRARLSRPQSSGKMATAVDRAAAAVIKGVQEVKPPAGQTASRLPRRL
jgi:lipid-A-disaccharide synthase